MCKVFVVYYHPEAHSFNQAMFETACRALAESGMEVRTSDLRTMKFNPWPGRDAYRTVKEPHFFKQQLEEMYASEQHSFAGFLEAELRKLEWCDLMIWQFPLWWFGLPSVFKGWVERVFVLGRVYRGDRLYEKGMFHGKRVLLSFTTGAPEAAYRRDGMNGELRTLLKPITHGMLAFTGFGVLNPNVVFAPAHLEEEDRVRALAEWETRLHGIGRERCVRGKA